jgi:hypothetical protein
MMRWEQSELARFFDAVHHNQRAHAENFPLAFSVLTEIDACFALGGKNLINPEVPLTGTLFLRSQYAYKTAAGAALAGQIVEAAQAYRLCLEMAAYALVLKGDPALVEVFILRHADAASKKLQRDAFNSATARAAVKAADPKLGEIFVELYERSIDFGAHPNPHGLFSAMEMRQGDEETTLVSAALCVDRAPLLHTFKAVAQSGMTALHIMQHVFAAKFQLLGIRARLETLRSVRFEDGVGL